MDGIEEVLAFWFRDDVKPHWFDAGPALDQTIRKEFGELYARAVVGELGSWETSPEGCLALCVLLDQMPRNMFRGDARAFATDDKALAIAERALANRFDAHLPAERKQFLYLPFLHSEMLANQLRALALFESQGMPRNRRYAEERVAIIRRFGRFPHRNAVLGRADTEAESAYLKTEPASYGQKARATPGV
jgi:uncharacterized protein (DUF924 family)